TETETETELLTGTFKLNATTHVSGLYYISGNNTGYTSANGEFSYQQNDDIQFFIGDIALPNTLAQATIDTVLLAGNSDPANTVTANITRLLIALDADQNPNNGIEITSATHQIAEQITLNFASSTFTSDSASLVASAGGLLPSKVTALENIAIALGADTSCGSSHEKIGTSAEFNTFAYGVAGTVTVVNDCTLLFTRFSYTGGGLPDVYFYTGPNGNFNQGSGFGPNLYGQTFEATTHIQTISSNALNELDAISIWCVQAGVDFGSGVFNR
ncbi:DM13 domain-containing protein, partial [Saccharophagus degradans]